MIKKYCYWFSLIMSLFVVTRFIGIETAIAHSGHEGPSKVFMKESEAVRTMLPQDGKILKRKEPLKKETSAEALRKWGSSPEEGIYTYYISKDINGKIQGALFIQTIEYKHGRITFAIAYNGSGYISDIQVLSCSEKHVIEVREELLDSGYLDTFMHKGTDEIISASEIYNRKKKEDIRYLTTKEIEKTSLLLKIFQGL